MSLLLTFYNCVKEEAIDVPNLVSLVRITQGKFEANCENGGSKIETGLDENLNGLLDTNEISSSNYICNGINGDNVLIKTTEIPKSINCENGGYLLEIGQDLNKDQILNDSEINSTLYICHGIDKKNSLINIINENPGKNCKNGGFKIEIGIDTNSNGFLNKEEVTQTKYICNFEEDSITVDINGGGDFTNLRTAIESIGSRDKPLNIYIEEGEYDIMSYFTQTEIETSGFKGLNIPHNVSLVGIGRKEFVHLKGELDTNIYPSSVTSIVSTLNTKGSGNFINLKVTALNLRYAIHDDVNFINLTRYVKDCIFYHYQGAGFGQAYGEGCRSGGNFTFENCYFYTEQNGSSYSTHNNVNFNKPSKHKYINCNFDNKEGDLAIRFGSMGSGQKDIIELVGCKFNGRIYIMEEQSNGVGIDFEITGYGNDVVPIEIKHTTNNQYTYNLIGQTVSRKNEGNSNISKGDALKLSLNGKGIEKMHFSDDTSLFYGIAFNDILQDDTGIIKIGGFHQISDTNLAVLNIGDKIGVDNGELSVVTTTEYIGIVILPDFIRIN